jgi:DNA-binding MarR family transcriptional regulator
MKKQLHPVDYQSLAELRHQIRRFLHFSEQAARNMRLEPRQHQLLLAIKGLPDGVRPRIGEFAERLQIQHHSAVELVNRLSRGGYVRRLAGPEDRREVLVTLTAKGEQVLRALSVEHREELRLQGPILIAALERVMQVDKNASGALAGTSAEKTSRDETSGEKTKTTKTKTKTTTTTTRKAGPRHGRG